jgi:hypothetical protein
MREAPVGGYDAVRADVRAAGNSNYRRQFPQAKGRVERNHGTHQDRLVKKPRRKKIRTVVRQVFALQTDLPPGIRLRD